MMPDPMPGAMRQGCSEQSTHERTDVLTNVLPPQATISPLSDALTREDIDPASSGNDDAPDSTDPVMQWGVRWPDGAVTPQRDQEAAHATAGSWASLDEPCTVVSRICGPWSDSETQLGGLSRDS